MLQKSKVDLDNNNRARLALIDPRQLTRMSLLALLTAASPGTRRLSDFTIMPYANPNEFVSDYLERPWSVGMIVLNIGAASVCEDDIHNAILRLRHELPDIPIVILSDDDELCNVLTAFRNGVRGYILSSFDPPKVIQALRLVVSGGTFIPDSTLEEIAEKTAGLFKEDSHDYAPIGAAVFDSFTPRQMEVLQLLREGKSNKFIAYELGMKECTVKTHVRKIMSKLKATNRTHAVFLLSQMTNEKN
ncbi:DNA-binding response regulator, NarL/FixJ family, contains REC and HTH domains [Nitrosomonas sp. Nm166]|nr:DNA-binding response regulator, NarL/FixJ family, contains REC and HTH domains [Nitrosomonas sp. Nm166]